MILPFTPPWSNTVLIRAPDVACLIRLWQPYMSLSLDNSIFVFERTPPRTESHHHLMKHTVMDCQNQRIYHYKTQDTGL